MNVNKNRFFLSTYIRTLLFRRRRRSPFDVIIDGPVMVRRNENRRSRIFDIDTVDIVYQGGAVCFPARFFQDGKSSLTHDRYITTTITTLTNNKSHTITRYFTFQLIFKVLTSSVLTSWCATRSQTSLS
jgi:hypothetical protein